MIKWIQWKLQELFISSPLGRHEAITYCLILPPMHDSCTAVLSLLFHTVSHNRYTIHPTFPVFKSFMCTNVVHNINSRYIIISTCYCADFSYIANYLAMQLLKNYLNLSKILKSELRKIYEQQTWKICWNSYIDAWLALSHVATI